MPNMFRSSAAGMTAFVLIASNRRYQRYVVNPVPNQHEIWTLRHPLRRMSRGKILRIILAEEATIVWSTDELARTNESQTTHQKKLNLWFADFPTAEWPAGSVFTFTIFWKRDQRWENRNWQVSVVLRTTCHRAATRRELIINNPKHARSQRPIRTIGWSI